MRIAHLMEKEIGDIYDKIFATPFFKTNIEPYIRDESNEDLTGYPLYHGSKKLTTSHMFTELPLKRRTGPKDSMPFVHHAANKAASDKLDVEVRNLMFATTSQIIASEYGDIYVMIPTGEYKMFYSSVVEDLYSNNDGMLGEDTRDQLIVHRFRKFLNSDEMKQSIETIKGSLEVKKLTFFVSSDKLLNRLPNIFDFDSIEEAYSEEYLPNYTERLYKVLIDVLYNTYDMSAVENADHSEAIHNELYIVAQKLVKLGEATDIEWLNQSAREYVDTIRETQKVVDVPSSHEVMLQADHAIFVPEDAWRDVVIRQYFQRK